MVIRIIYAEGHFGKAGYRNVAQARIPGVGNVRIQAISYLSFYKGKGAFKTVGDKSLLRRQSHENIILYCKNRIRKLPGGAGNKIPLQLSFGQGFILGQGMIRRASRHRLYGQKQVLCTTKKMSSAHILCPKPPEAECFPPFPG